MWMDPTLKVALLLFMLLGLVNSSFIKHDYGRCERIVQNWASSALNQGVKDDKHTLRQLLFFLHVPRTGGRTYFHCFLRRLFPNSSECPRSYDKLRFDPRKAKCKLLANHDDYSVISKLPREKTSVVTILRNPIDRVFSTYEFSIEVGARFLVHDNLTSATKMSGRLRAKTKGVSTLDIWPWKYLVPWMREDLFARRESRQLRSVVKIQGSDSYNMKDVAMPLQEYINSPTALDIVHNGATFQVAGLTNNSYLSDSHDIRHCVQLYKNLGEFVLQVAKKRLDDMLYVGVTEDHKGSATMFANLVGAQVFPDLDTSNSNTIADGPPNSLSDHSSSLSDPEHDDTDHQNSMPDLKASHNQSVEAKSGNTTVDTLIKDYEVCISGLRKSQSGRRTNSLKRISPVNFSKEARLRVSDKVMQQIRYLNSLDLELYKHAQDIFSKQQNYIRENIVTPMSVMVVCMNFCALSIHIFAVYSSHMYSASSVVNMVNMPTKVADGVDEFRWQHKWEHHIISNVFGPVFSDISGDKEVGCKSDRVRKQTEKGNQSISYRSFIIMLPYPSFCITPLFLLLIITPLMQATVLLLNSPLPMHMHDSWFFNENFNGVPDNFFDDVFKFVDFPMEDVEPNEVKQDWEASFHGLEPPPADIFAALPDNFSGQVINDVKPLVNCPALCDAVLILIQESFSDVTFCSEPFIPVSQYDEASQLKQFSTTDKAISSEPTFIHENYIDVKKSRPFQSCSPVSVLESSSSCSAENNNNTAVFCPKLFSPVKRSRSKRPRPSIFNPHRFFPFILYTAGSDSDSGNPVKRKPKRKRNVSYNFSPAEFESSFSQQVTRKCTHCETTKTPQWREGPMGPKTLCNACGVRYRSGRLLPEYRPASSPTFVPTFHSNSHRKVVEMRKKAVPSHDVDDTGIF
ncbi:hypothetical protein ACFE04_005165 [Oxalis oulophora]